MLKKSLKFSIVIAVICLSSVMCAGGFDITPISTNFNIQGKVTDAKDGTPIGGATVCIDNWGELKCCQYTSVNGDYYISNFPVSVIARPKLYVGNQGQGYTDKWVYLEITSNLQTINVALERKTQ